MNFKIIPTAVFAEKAKLLAKRYPSMKDDLSVLQNELLENPELGISLGNNIRKIRMRICSKNKGKSGGARVITYLIKTSLDEGVINLVTIYDKSDRESISIKEINSLLVKCHLL
ncbi:hypothetical protein [Parabacteroides goldsteinii]|uniref:hypothetical protein n=1 Tax=Parabacteroides goldsteinii TaxID=328812 RepID=UPI00256F1EB7|nr:hypothetical protein [Parabacteroides goldsteinii]